MWRVNVLFFLILCAFTLIIVRLFYWQILSGDALRQQAYDQYNLELTLPAQRGQIKFSDNAPLVMNEPSYLVYAQPKEINSKEQFSRLIAPILSLDEQSVFSDISAEGRVWVPLAKKVDSAAVDTLQQLHELGLGFEPMSKRYYPEASMAAQLTGFVGSDQYGNDKGYFGLEGFYDRELRGKDGYIQAEKDVNGAPIPIEGETRIEAENGSTLTLSIDRTIQRIVESRLSDGVAAYGAKSGSVVIMDPSTGGILAMASYPSYDPLNYDAFDKSLYVNPVVADAYEPGSTFKVLVMSAAINEHVVTPETIMDENGPVQVGPYLIRTWNNQYHGPQTMTQIIQNSSNVGMVFVENKLGRDKMLQYIHSFGIGALTNIDLQDEATPLLRSDSDWKDIDLATASFGQGIAVTPLQMVRAVSVIANGGWLMEPHVVQSIIDSRGRMIDIPPKRIRQVVSKETTDFMKAIMINAVDNGEAKFAKPKGYTIAGKTGTAQIPVAGHYDATKTIASFIGFAPADHPLFVMLVTINQPTSSQWGSETAAPLFFTIAHDIFMYKGIPPQP
ncbi:MAG TPA: penicillin-binding protein 2 [Patescibacteria group bacterium]|nr:penicillin-binding protein 2 [Patescibacteria group bacterium]